MPSCGWCNSLEVSRWESRIAAGESLSAVAADTPFSESAARRHVRLHLQARLGVERMEPTSTVRLSDFVDHLFHGLARARAIGDFAFQSGNGRLALQAGREERDIILALTHRLGIDSEERAELLRQVEGVFRGINRATRTGELQDLEALAWLMDEEGVPLVAAGLRARARELDLTPPLPQTEGVPGDAS